MALSPKGPNTAMWQYWHIQYLFNIHISCVKEQIIWYSYIKRSVYGNVALRYYHEKKQQLDSNLCNTSILKKG